MAHRVAAQWAPLAQRKLRVAGHDARSPLAVPTPVGELCPTCTQTLAEARAPSPAATALGGCP